MKQLLASTAIGLVLGVAPALAQTEPAAPESPPAMQQQAEPAEPSSPSGEASPPAKSTEAPEPAEPDKSAAEAPSGGAQFLSKQESNDWLANDFIGKSVVNANNETIGDINDLVTDENGKIVAVLIGTGGFLEMGEKDVAVRFEDLKITRDEDNDVSIMANLSKDVLASAPDFETLAEQEAAVGATDEADRTAQ
jgi:sporulation protein YlmC with PRC-barrel domain